jgi:uncharacterized membrane protein
MSEQPATNARLLLAHRIILGCYYGLLALFLFISLTALDRFSVATPVIWLLQSLPLLIFIGVVHGGKASQLIWFSLVVLLYFMHGVLVAFDSARLINGLVEVGLSAILFCTLMLYLKLARTKAPDTTTSS